ncbi:MAG: TlpA family protein disulfide reductase [Bacteroidetes bacterium]|nr:TlpA family protein disulfide reductase [Bacteroidota bacterium]
MSGKIMHAKADSGFIADPNKKTVAIFNVSKKGEFNTTFYATSGYYTFNYGEEYTNVYLKPGFNLQITLDTKEFDESIKYKGVGAAENNYLAEKLLLDAKLEKVNNYEYYGKLTEAPFLQLTDSVYKLYVNLFNAHKDFCSDFRELELNKLLISKTFKLADYRMIHAYVTKNDSFKTSSSYPNPYADFDVNNDKLLSMPGFIELLERYYNEKYSNGAKDSSDYFLSYLNFLDKTVENKIIKEELAFKSAKMGISYTKELNQYYNLYTSIATNKEQKERIAIKYEKLKKITRGLPSPKFELVDINGKMVSLDNLKGKYVYIDVWATWCGPCKREIPHLKKLEDDFHSKNIAFVSICVFDKKNNWEKMVKEKELKGIQLFTDNKEEPFIKSYVIEGVPRFILLDTDGNIIDSNASRPSEPTTKSTLEKLVGKN